MAEVDIRIRDTEAQDDQPLLLWDTVWNANLGALDWKIAGKTLQSSRILDTAILLQLATWRRAEPYDVLPSGADPKGWWGNAVDIEDDEDQLGSKLWLLYRAPLNDATANKAKQYATQCLQPLINQGAVVRFDIVPSYDVVKGMLALQIDGYSQDGQRIYSQKFSRLWAQEFS